MLYLHISKDVLKEKTPFFDFFFRFLHRVKLLVVLKT